MEQSLSRNVKIKAGGFCYTFASTNHNPALQSCKYTLYQKQLHLCTLQYTILSRQETLSRWKTASNMGRDGMACPQKWDPSKMVVLKMEDLNAAAAAASNSKWMIGLLSAVQFCHRQYKGWQSHSLATQSALYTRSQRPPWLDDSVIIILLPAIGDSI